MDGLCDPLLAGPGLSADQDRHEPIARDAQHVFPEDAHLGAVALQIRKRRLCPGRRIALHIYKTSDLDETHKLMWRSLGSVGGLAMRADGSGRRESAALETEDGRWCQCVERRVARRRGVPASGAASASNSSPTLTCSAFANCINLTALGFALASSTRPRYL